MVNVLQIYKNDLYFCGLYLTLIKISTNDFDLKNPYCQLTKLKCVSNVRTMENTSLLHEALALNKGFVEKR